jgi:hypothetical protein
MSLVAFYAWLMLAGFVLFLAVVVIFGYFCFARFCCGGGSEPDGGVPGFPDTAWRWDWLSCSWCGRFTSRTWAT